MPDQLQNARIDQLPEGNPQVGDWLVFRDMTNSVTKKFKADMLFTTDTSNFEWIPDANEGDGYAEDEVVTYGGGWWQSEVDDNLSVPGINADWTAIARGFSWQQWQASVYVDVSTFVLKTIGTSTYVYELVNATRPYTSTNFDTELTAGDWQLLGVIQVIEVDTTLVSDEITLNFLKLQQIDFKESAQITENKEMVLTNPIEGLRSFFSFSMNGTYNLVFPAGVKVTGASNASWGSLTWTPLEAGEYEMEITYRNSQYKIRIHGPYS